MTTLFHYKFEDSDHESVGALEIAEEEHGFYLFLFDKNAESLGDYWGAELEEVMAQAEHMCGVKPPMWHAVTPPESLSIMEG